MQLKPIYIPASYSQDLDKYAEYLVKTDNYSELRTLLEFRPIIHKHYTNRFKSNLLEVASQYGSYSVLPLLTKYNPHTTNSKTYPALHRAIVHGHLQFVKNLSNYFTLNFGTLNYPIDKIKYSLSAVDIAINNDRLDILKYLLLEQGCTISYSNAKVSLKVAMKKSKYVVFEYILSILTPNQLKSIYTYYSDKLLESDKQYVTIENLFKRYMSNTTHNNLFHNTPRDFNPNNFKSINSAYQSDLEVITQSICDYNLQTSLHKH